MKITRKYKKMSVKMKRECKDSEVALRGNENI